MREFYYMVGVSKERGTSNFLNMEGQVDLVPHMCSSYEFIRHRAFEKMSKVGSYLEANRPVDYDQIKIYKMIYSADENVVIVVDKEDF